MSTTYEALLSLWQRIRELEARNRTLEAQIKTLHWRIDEGWDPGQ